MDKKIGKIAGRTGTLLLKDEATGAVQHEIRYELRSFEEGTMWCEGKAWRLECWHGSRSVTISTLTCEGTEMPHEEWAEYWRKCEQVAYSSKDRSPYVRPEWVPEWMEWVEPGPHGVCDILYMIRAHAIQSLCEETGTPFDDDIECYVEDEDGFVEVWVEDEE